MVCLPLFAWSVFLFVAFNLKVFRLLAFFPAYTFYFIVLHCLFLGFGLVTWTLGGSPILGCLAFFCFSFFFSMFFTDYLFNSSKVG